MSTHQEFPLDDYEALFLGVGKRPDVNVTSTFVRRFPGTIPIALLEAETARWAANPKGFGRRVVGPRIPGAQPRWRVDATPPPVTVVGPLDRAELARWLDAQASVRFDLEREHGWRWAAATTDDETIVAVTVHHAYGDGVSLLTAVAGGLDGDTALSTSGHGLLGEAGDLVRRVRGGAEASLEVGALLGRRALGLPRGLLRRAADSEAPEPADEGPTPTAADAATGPSGAAAAPIVAAAPVAATADDSPAGPAAEPQAHGAGAATAEPQASTATADRPASARIVAVADVDEHDWDRAAAAHGGTGNTLVVAVVANLLRRIRPNDGTDGGPISIAIPIYARDRYASGQEHAAGTAGVTLISAKLDVPAGPPQHDGLDRLRTATKAAFVAATAAAPPPGQRMRLPPPLRILRLLPDPLAFRAIAALAPAVTPEGMSSNLGPVPDGLTRIGRFRATTTLFLPAVPKTLIVGLGRSAGRVTLGVVADPRRLPAGLVLADQLDHELRAWGVVPTVW